MNIPPPPGNFSHGPLNCSHGVGYGVVGRPGKSTNRKRAEREGAGVCDKDGGREEGEIDDKRSKGMSPQKD